MKQPFLIIPAARTVVALLFVFLASVIAPAIAHAGPTADAGPYHLSVTTDPPLVPAQGKVTLRIRITDHSGQPISGMTVRALTKMPGMDMGEREGNALPLGKEPGLYATPATFAMVGDYDSSLALSGPLGKATAHISLRTGQNTEGAAKSGFPWLLLLGSLLGLGLVLLLLWRMRHTDQLPDTRAMFTRQTMGALLLLVVITGAAFFAVRNLRRPGALTPIDAQAMDMSYMPPPPGFVPVELATVSRGTVESRVRYTASAVGFTEQPVYSRITGTLLSMPFYAGDRVKRGQVLARLDTSQTQPQQAERQAAVAQASQGIAVARAEQKQAEASITQAHAELAGKRGAVTEARNNVEAAKAALANVEAARQAAQAQIADAEAQLTAAQADSTFWKAQIERSAALLKAGAISGEEFQHDRAQAQSADAKVQQAEAQITRMKADARAQEAAVRQATAQIASAEAKVQIAQSELSAHVAHVQETQAARDTARQKVGQAQSGVAGARAMLTAATANQGYSEIRSPFNGVVVARQIPPGTLVSPGQAILTIAQIDPVRVQASLPQNDLAAIRVGASVEITGRDGTGPKKPLPALITSIVPAVDTTARTGIVEAVIANPGQTILPGQYLTMTLTTGARRDALRVPTRALVYRPVSGEMPSDRTLPIVWVAEEAGATGQFTVRPVPVQVGLPGSETTEIISGLSEGQRVVVTGATNLKEGDTVAESPASPTATGPMVEGAGNTSASSSQVAVAVTERGFEPSSLTLTAGVPAHITFTRKTDNTCAKEVVFPDYGINKPLPLNTPVIVSFTPKKGTFAFVCGMNMVKGKVVAR